MIFTMDGDAEYKVSYHVYHVYRATSSFYQYATQHVYAMYHVYTSKLSHQLLVMSYRY